MKKKSSVYLKLLLSYLGILIIPIVVALGVYSRAWQVIQDQTVKINENLLSIVQHEIDNEIKNIQKIESRLALDTDVQILSKKKGELSSKNQQFLYYLYRDLRMLSVSEPFLEHIFVYFPETEKISSNFGNMNLSLYYDLYYKNDKMNGDEFEEYLNEPHHNDVLQISNTSGNELILFTMSVLNGNAEEEQATIGVAVNAEQFRKKLLFGKWNDQMHLVIKNQNSDVVCMDAESMMVSIIPDPKSYIITGIKSDIVDWRYEAVIPKNVIDSEAKEIQIWSLVGLFVCLIAGFIIANYLARKNYNPLKSLMDKFAGDGGAKVDAKENEFQWLNRQVDQFFKEHIDIKHLLKNSRKAIKTYYLLRLLMEHCEKNQPEQSGITLQSEFYAVVLLKPEPKGELTEERLGEEAAALRKFIISNILGEICHQHFEVEAAELGDQEAVIVGMDEPSQENMEILQKCIENLQQITEESFEFVCTALLGSACKEIGGIHESYIQAKRMEEYVSLLEVPVICYDKVKDLQFSYEYPEELEQKIINAMKAGDQKTAGQCMMEVFDRNLSGHVKANTYQCLLFDMIGTLLKGASTGGYNHAEKEISMLDAVSVKTPVKEAKEQFLNCLDQICFQIRELCSRASDDRTFSQNVEAYVRETFQDPDLNISIASQHFGMTPSYLSSLYKKQTGKSLLEFINNIRIDYAEELLKNGYTVSDAAERSGFRDSAGFIRAFKKKKGITPGQLKKKF